MANSRLSELQSGIGQKYVNWPPTTKKTSVRNWIISNVPDSRLSQSMNPNRIV